MIFDAETRDNVFRSNSSKSAQIRAVIISYSLPLLLLLMISLDLLLFYVRCTF